MNTANGNDKPGLFVYRYDCRRAVVYCVRCSLLGCLLGCLAAGMLLGPFISGGEKSEANLPLVVTSL
jgi:hypothetical protein